MKIKLLKRFTGSLILLLLILPLISFTNNSSDGLKIIVIDPGHGGIFPGTSGSYSVEKDVTLKIALRLGKAIEETMKDVKVIYTRTTDTQFSSNKDKDLSERPNIANRAKADLLISIHCNSMAEGTKNRVSVRGVETFVAGSARLDEQDAALKQYADFEGEYKFQEAEVVDEESAIVLSLLKNAVRGQSIRLATFLQEEYVSTGRIDRGVKELSLAILRTAAMPAILTEVGFLSNREEEDYLNSENGQNEIVSCLLNAIQTYKKLI